MSFLPISRSDGAQTERAASTAYLLLNSADRNQNASVGGTSEVEGQRWNDFRLQRAQPLLGSFARRIRPVEVRFPWFIPNIMAGRNDTLWFNFAPYTTPVFITLPSKFYLPAELVTELNAAIAVVQPTTPPTFAYDVIEQTYTISNTGTDFVMGTTAANVAAGPAVIPASTFTEFQNNASLLKTLGYTWNIQGLLIATGGEARGLATLSSYTDYVDIQSNKLMNYTDVWDGSGGEGVKNLIVRIYADNEISIPTADGGDYPVTCRPFPIHRQFMMPKAIKWNPQASIDWLDIRVVDMYGELVPIPPYNVTDSPAVTSPYRQYPDFQITLLCSED